MSFKLTLRVVPLAVLVAGCMDAHIGERNAAFGEAVKYNAAIQTINPDPVYPEGSAQPGSNGERGAKAVERYRQGQTKQVEQVMTTGGSGTGASSGPP